ncbi:MAG: protein-glutamate O-methyltransferase CheR [Kiritimatiellae bacterium]|nr:protein-glutamate O-methyltransferase CheR [Kiritimatiellia bacterium]
MERSRRPDQDDGEAQIPHGMSITDHEFDRIRELVYSRFGINLTEQKRSLVVGRLQKVLKQKNFATFSDFIRYVEADKTGEALDTLVNRISTNHTFFFREKEHFTYLTEQALPEVVGRMSDRDMRLWCAACSSGEESYGLAMLLMDYFGEDYRNWNAGLLATDISAHVLGIARRGVYPSDRVREVPPMMKNRYFTKVDKENYQVTEAVRREVTYRRFNLMNTDFPFKKPFHIVFCRNVMIYFDVETRDALARRFFDHMMPGGYLFIGHSETLRRDICPFEYVRPAVYRKPLK